MLFHSDVGPDSVMRIWEYSNVECAVLVLCSRKFVVSNLFQSQHVIGSRTLSSLPALATHHALQIQEILLSILDHCRPPSQRRSALALARTCRAIKEPALYVLWENLYDASPLAKCHPEALASHLSQGDRVSSFQVLVSPDSEYSLLWIVITLPLAWALLHICPVYLR